MAPPKKPFDAAAELRKLLASAATTPAQKAALRKGAALLDAAEKDRMKRESVKAHAVQAARRSKRRAKPAAAAGGTYQYTIDVAYRNVAAKYPDVVIHHTVAYNADHELTPPELDLVVDEALRLLAMDYTASKTPYDPVEVRDQRKVQLHRLPAAGKARALADAKLKAASVPGLSGVSVVPATPLDRPGECVMNALRAFYGDTLKKLVGTAFAKDVEQGAFHPNDVVALALLGHWGTYGETDGLAVTAANVRKLLKKRKVRAAVDALCADGVTCHQLLAFARAAGVHMYLRDEDNADFMWWPQHGYKGKLNENVRAMVARVQNSHLYAIDGPTEAYRSASRVRSAHKPTGAADDGEAKEAAALVTRAYHGDVANGFKELWEAMVDEGRRAGTDLVFPTDVRLSHKGHGITSFAFERPDGGKLVHVMDEDKTALCDAIAARVGLDAGLSLPQIAAALAARHCAALPTSCPNPNVDRVLRTEGLKNRAHHGLCDSDITGDQLRELVRHGRASCRDVCKAHPAEMLAAKDEWMALAFHDDFEAWNRPQDFAPLPLGLYAVTTDDMNLFGGSGVYTRRLLEEARDESIDYEITAFCPASVKAPADAFHALVTATVEATHPFDLPFGVDADDMAAAAKVMLASHAGRLGKDAESTVSKLHINTDRERVGEWVTDAKKMKGVPIVMELPDLADAAYAGDAPFMYGYQSAAPLAEHNVPMYMQLTDHAAIRLHRLRKAMGGRMLYRKVDLIVMEGPPACVEDDPRDAVDVTKLPIDGDRLSVGLRVDADGGVRINVTSVATHARRTLATFGTSRPEHDVPKYIVEMAARALSEGTEFVAPEWTDMPFNDSSQAADGGPLLQALVATKDGALTKGKPGVGKTFVVKQLQEHYGADAVMCVAPTHAAAGLLGGRTIASFIGLNTRTRQVGLKGIRSRLKGIQVIVVDEFSMVGAVYLRAFCAIKRAFPDIKWILLGDERQLPPVEDDRSCFDLSATRWLVGNRRVTLTVSHRNEPELEAVMEDAWAGRSIAARLRCEPLDCAVHFAADNVTCWAVNDVMMAREKPADAVHVPEDATDERSREAWLFAGLPLVARTPPRPKKPASSKDAQADDESEEAELPSRDVKRPSDEDQGHAVAYNMERFLVTAVRPDGSFDAQSLARGHTVSLPLAAFHAHFVVGFCMTVHKAQGQTIAEDFAVWNPHLMDKRCLWTALSRGKRLDQIHVGTLAYLGLDAVMKRRDQAIMTKLRTYKTHDRAMGRPICDATLEDCHAILARQDEKCFHCSRDLKVAGYEAKDKSQLSWDRIRDGAAHGHTVGNLVASCLACNEAHKNHKLVPV